MSLFETLISLLKLTGEWKKKTLVSLTSISCVSFKIQTFITRQMNTPPSRILQVGLQLVRSFRFPWTRKSTHYNERHIFSKANLLKRIRHNGSALSLYGHHFLIWKNLLVPSRLLIKSLQDGGKRVLLFLRVYLTFWELFWRQLG